MFCQKMRNKLKVIKVNYDDLRHTTNGHQAYVNQTNINEL
jgi:hypothetical protein